MLAAAGGHFDLVVELHCDGPSLIGVQNIQAVIY
jgi:hypothetical protein